MWLRLKMRSHWIRAGPKTNVLIKAEKNMGWPREEGHMEAEIGVTLAQDKKHQEPPSLKEQEGPCPGDLRGATTLPASWFQIPGLQNSVRNKYLLFQGPTLWWFAMAALGNEYTILQHVALNLPLFYGRPLSPKVEVFFPPLNSRRNWCLHHCWGLRFLLCTCQLLQEGSLFVNPSRSLCLVLTQWHTCIKCLMHTCWVCGFPSTFFTFNESIQ